MNLRSVIVFFSCAVLFPNTVQAQVFSNLFYNLDRFIEFFTFGLIDIKNNDAPQDINDNLPGGLVFGGVCNRLKNIALNQLAGQIPVELQTIADSVKCGCDVLRLGGEMKFGCNFENPVCLNITEDLLPFDDDFTDDFSNSTGRRLQDSVVGLCATANIRADYNGRSLLTPFARETLTTSACAELINATFFKDGTSVPKLCAKVQHNDGLTNLASLKSCSLYVIRPDKSIEVCNKCEICGADGLGVKFDCSNINLDNSGKNNWTIPVVDSECLSAGTIPLSKINDESFVYRPFLTPMP
jgi:hypothetical protein